MDESVEVGNEAVQGFVAIYKGLAFELEDIYLTKQGIELLKTEGKLNNEQNDYFESYMVEITEVSLAEVDLDDSSQVNYSGNTSLQDVINSGISQAEIEAISGITITNTSLLLRDYAEDNGLSYGGLKEDLQAFYEENIHLSE